MNMKIKRYKIIQGTIPGEYRVIDKLKDDYVCIPLTSNSPKDLEEIMGKDMDKLVDSNKVKPGYLQSKI